MVKRILISSLLLISFGCSPIKKINNNVVSGEFDKAINKTISELKKIKNKKKKIQYELILKDIYNRAVVNSKDKISRFKKDGNPEFFDDIYFEYDKLIKRQNKLKNLSSERLNFNFENYDSELINFRYKTSDYFLKISNSFISNNNKFDYRKAYNYLTVIESINPNYLDTRSLIKLCLVKGKDYILLNVLNESKSVLFEDLEKDILNIKGYDLNSTWKSFFTKNDSFEGTYDFYIDLAFKSFIISPERLVQKEGFSEKNIVDGLTYKLDDEGNVMKDSLGNDIKVDKLIKISVKSIESIQSKSAKVLAEIRFIDKKKNIIEKFPLESEFWFRNRFLEYDGDKRVLTKEQIKLSKNRFMPFPPDEVLIFNNSENIKRKMKRIIYKSFN
tara:strand:+ start:660 stop:1820 length:1161 start_codon:yes stop_codon:yes gene_type:complete